MAVEFSQKALKEFKSLDPIFDNPKSRLIPTLYIAQREFGYLSKEAIEYVSSLLDLTPAKVMEVASFYTMLHKKPVGKYEITICTNITCAMLKSRELLSHTLKKLNIKENEMSPDKSFTVRREECLGACDKAPALKVNDQFHYKVTPEKLDKILSDCEKAK